MTDTKRDAKLVQYLSEAYAKEKELESALEAHIAMTTRKPYKKRLQDHLKETKAHGRALQRRVKQVGGGGPQFADRVFAQAAGKAKALAKGPMHAARGSGEAEKMLKNAKAEYFNEHEEIATYAAIETLAEQLGDGETAKLARGIRRDEERMAKFLAAQIPVLTRAVVTEEVPASERRAAGSAGSRSRSRASRSARGRSTRSRSSGSRSSESRSSGSRSGSRSSGSRSSRSRARSGSTSRRSRS
jgi:ferritin-like metal-binding protein YciE